MSPEPAAYFCTGSLLNSLPCGKPAARVRVTRTTSTVVRVVSVKPASELPGASYIAYLCLDHKQQARSAGWIIEAEPRTAKANQNLRSS